MAGAFLAQSSVDAGVGNTDSLYIELSMIRT